MSIKLPNFLVPGAMKSGTTSLWRYLQQHPQVYMPVNKEPRFLASSIFVKLGEEHYRFHGICKSRPVCTFEDYCNLFEDVEHETAISEASPHYLYLYSKTIPTIKNYLGDVKIIIILRNPADRAFSAYKHNLLVERSENRSFEKCLKSEEKTRKKKRLPMMHFYQDLGFYYKQVRAYVEAFSSVKVCLYDDMVSNPLGLMQDIYGFLEVDPAYVPSVELKHNVSPQENVILGGFILNYNHPLKKVFRPIFLNTIGRNNTERLVNLFKIGEQRTMKPETRRYLIELYREDIIKLQALIERDLSGWLE